MVPGSGKYDKQMWKAVQGLGWDVTMAQYPGSIIFQAGQIGTGQNTVVFHVGRHLPKHKNATWHFSVLVQVAWLGVGMWVCDMGAHCP